MLKRSKFFAKIINQILKIHLSSKIKDIGSSVLQLLNKC